MFMRGLLFLLAVLIPLQAAAESDSLRLERLDSVVVSSSRASALTPVTFTSVGKDELHATNPSSSLPSTLGLLPSVVSTVENGTGLGYSYIKIRGVSGSQINVTLNGLPLNDSESQEVFWVNIPALTGILSGVQVQRGLGTSASGTGAFGASINMNTAFVGADPSVGFEASYGSYNTLMTLVSASTGILKKGFYLSGAYSEDRTDGYIRGGSVTARSAFAAIGWLGANSSLRLTYLMGSQKSGITWNGIDLETYARDRRFNSSGMYLDEFGNVQYHLDYDRYAQHNLQLNYTQSFLGCVAWTTTLGYTRGDGYDEYWVGSDPTYTRRYMGNDFYALKSDVKYTSEKLLLTAGASGTFYHGRHFGKDFRDGEVGDFSYGEVTEIYRNRTYKGDWSVYARMEYRPIRQLNAYLDLQYRGISLDMKGLDDGEEKMDFSTMWHFFNPRAGLTASLGKNRIYASAAFGHREPGRGDLKEVIAYNNASATDKQELKPEKMVDVEIGYGYESEKFSAGVNLYFMEYWDMLLETGRLSKSGYAIKNNVDRAYRRGIELSVAWAPARWVSLRGNLTLSLNKIARYEDHATDVDDDYNYLSTWTVYEGGVCSNTDILLSPSVIGMAEVGFKPFATTTWSAVKWLALTASVKGVGKQYLDNTSSKDRLVPAYYVCDLSLTDTIPLKAGKLTFGFYVSNFTNHLYYTGGGAWKLMHPTDGFVSGIYIYPQPPVSFTGKVAYNF